MLTIQQCGDKWRVVLTEPGFYWRVSHRERKEALREMSRVARAGRVDNATLKEIEEEVAKA
jgi:hypothetical protein